MNQRRELLRGTFFLTAAGFLTKTAGFFYKIFLSRTIGAEQIGLYQLTMPVYVFCSALSSGGIQMAVSRFTATYCARKDHASALRFLCCGMALSLFLSICCASFLFSGASWIAGRFLLEPACAPLLQILAVSLPFGVLHACLSGYLIGRKRIKISASSQLTEQLVRITAVLLFYSGAVWKNRQMDGRIMALGQVAGELSAFLFCIFALLFFQPGALSSLSRRLLRRLLPGRRELKEILSFSLPVGLNRTLLCILQTIEAALLPLQLQRSGLDGGEALSFYGVLTGMALPLILFPTAMTGALSSLLLPAVSEARALNQSRQIDRTARTSVQGSLLLGCFFLGVFFLSGEELGRLLFHTPLAGRYIRRLALLCPFLYLNTAVSGILHGFDRTTDVFLWNTAGFLIRLLAIFLLVPGRGIDGYAAGLLLGQILISLCSLSLLGRITDASLRLSLSLGKPLALCAGCLAPFLLPAGRFLPGAWAGVILQTGLYTALFLLGFFFFLMPPEARAALPFLPAGKRRGVDDGKIPRK